MTSYGYNRKFWKSHGLEMSQNESPDQNVDIAIKSLSNGCKSFQASPPCTWGQVNAQAQIHAVGVPQTHVA